jgi:Secretion system C-terminal sorting domain
MPFLNKFSILIVLSIFSVLCQAQTVVNVPVNVNWFPTGYVRNLGEDLIICSKGEVRGWSTQVTECWREVTPGGIGRANFTSTSAPCITCPVLSLIGKIGVNGTPFYVGERCILQASASNLTGQLYLQINDTSLDDNSGEWEVSIANNCNDLFGCFESPEFDPAIQVKSNGDWMPTGISKEVGDEIIFCGKGEIRAWTPTLQECWRLVTPAGLGRTNYVNNTFPCTNCPILSLIGKVSVNGIPFYIGSRAVLQNTNTDLGEIFLRINDLSIDDNEGDFSVAITKSCVEILGCFDNQLISGTENPKRELMINTISIYPNPANDIINIQINLKQNSPISFKMYDITGKLISFNHFDLVDKSQVLTLPIPDNIHNQLILVQMILGNQVISKVISVI